MPFDTSELNSLVACLGIVPPRDLCIVLPGGAEICIQFPSVKIPDPMELVIQLFAQLNAALAPLAPFFRLLDLILAIVECIKAIPQSLLPPNPAPIISCLVGLIEALVEVLKLIPFISLPFTLAAILDALIAFLGGLENQLRLVVAKNLRLIQLALAPATPGAAFVISCEKSILDAYLKNLSEALKPLNRLLGVINLFMLILGQSEIPAFDAIGSAASEAQGYIDNMAVVRENLQTIRSFLPIPTTAPA